MGLLRFYKIIFFIAALFSLQLILLGCSGSMKAPAVEKTSSDSTKFKGNPPSGPQEIGDQHGPNPSAGEPVVDWLSPFLSVSTTTVSGDSVFYTHMTEVQYFKYNSTISLQFNVKNGTGATSETFYSTFQYNKFQCNTHPSTNSSTIYRLQPTSEMECVSDADADDPSKVCWTLINDESDSSTNSVLSLDDTVSTIQWTLFTPGSSAISVDPLLSSDCYQARIIANDDSGGLNYGYSQIFKIDGDNPKLSQFGLASNQGGWLPLGSSTSTNYPVLGAQVKQKGFVNFYAPNVKDNTSKIEKVCVKESDSNTPSLSDPCWVGISNYSTAYTEKSEITVQPSDGPLKLSYYLGLREDSFFPTFNVWYMDSAGNYSCREFVSGQTTNKEGDLCEVNQLSSYLPAQFSFTTAYQELYPVSASVTNSSLDLAIDSTGEDFSAKTGVAAGEIMSLPGQIVVTPKGDYYFIRNNGDASDGLYKVTINSSLSNPSTVKIIPVSGANMTSGTLSTSSTVGTATLKNPLQISLDENGGLWVRDVNAIGYIDPVTSQFSIKIGLSSVGVVGTDTADSVASAQNLKIDDSSSVVDEIRRFGTFVALPGGKLLFNSEDALLKIDSSVSGNFRLRYYDPKSENQIVSIKLPNTAAGNIDIKNYIPYSNFGVIWDFENRTIKTLYVRACQAVGNCTTPYGLKFTMTGPQLPERFTLQSDADGASGKTSNMAWVSNLSNLFVYNINKGLIAEFNTSLKTFINRVGKKGDPIPASSISNICWHSTDAEECAIRTESLYVGRGVLPGGLPQLFIKDNGVLRGINGLRQIGNIYKSTP